jgi:hypothetical protein
MTGGCVLKALKPEEAITMAAERLTADRSENSLRSLDYIKAIDGSRQTTRDILYEACSNGLDTVVLGKRGNSVQPADVRLPLARNEFI